MIISWKTLNIENRSITVKATTYEPGDAKMLGDIYFKWLDLNAKIKSISTRGINLPEAISENAFCMFNKDCLRVVSVRGQKCSFDAINIRTGKKIQIKASSIEEDLTSFGPRSEWDELYFLDFSRADGTFDIYNIHPDLVYNQLMNATQTFEDQQNQGKRPRFSIKRDIIKRKSMAPIMKCSLLTHQEL